MRKGRGKGVSKRGGRGEGGRREGRGEEEGEMTERRGGREERKG